MALISPIRLPPPPDEDAGLGAGVADPPSSFIKKKGSTPKFFTLELEATSSGCGWGHK